ncbi:MAG: 2Fe-2S iron-sulfur cluster-binding protein [Spirochaetes bacterium]|nr:2Fe-2S iron-sulfur cluster-binding protein [Spirochaetota bacterium]
MNCFIVIGSGPTETRYEFEADPSKTVLDALEAIRGSKAPNLLYRHSCHHGSCGTCGALVNGKPRLMCLTRVGDLGGGEIRLEPLSKMEVIEGLAVWPGPLFERLPETEYLRLSTDRAKSGDFDPAQAVFRLEDCLECGLCVAACPVEGKFSGPAALLAAAVEREKHAERGGKMLEFAARPEGVGHCERRFECSKVCPQGLSPGRRITELRKALGL